MASIISKRPVIGFISGGIFAALGALIIDTGGMSGIRGKLHAGVGFFLVIVGVFAIFAAMISLWSVFRAQKNRLSAPSSDEQERN